MFENETGEISPRKIGIFAVIILCLIVGLLFLFSSFETVSAGERGIVLKWGRVDRVLTEGFWVINPISEDVVTIDVRVQKNTSNADAASKDLQMVTSVVALNYHLDSLKVGELYARVGREYDERIIQPAVQEAVKVGTARFTAEELISKRSEVKSAIMDDLTKRLQKFDITVDDFSIVNFDFSADFNKAVEKKVTAEQDALASENKLKQVEFEAQQQIAKAKAEAESTRLQVQALTAGSEVIELRKVEAMLELAKRWDGKLPVNIYGSAALPILNLSK